MRVGSLRFETLFPAFVGAALVAAWIAGMGSPAPWVAAQPPRDSAGPAEPRWTPGDNAPTEKDHPALHNLLRVADGVYSGGEPRGDEAFASLRRLGIKTVVSVDGARPNLEAARKHGLRYVHAPLGYDGVNAAAALVLTRLVRENHGPIYVHCHHGKHRGPAAAAIACVAAGAVTGRQARAILEHAGTGREYAGLWRDVEKFQPPAADVALPPLVEFAAVDSLTAAMAKLDRAHDNLKLCRQAGWRAPPAAPDLDGAHEALLLVEGLRESGRHLSDDYDAAFRAMLVEAERRAEKLDRALRAKQTDEADRLLCAVGETCQACHAKYRNR